jgi:hypothetical protein
MTTRQIWIIFKDRKLFVSTILILVGLFFCGFYLFRDKVRTKSDLIEINAKLRHFSFQRYGIRNDHYSYYLYFAEYGNRFQIIADFISFFNKDYFEKTVKNGDSLRIYISSYNFNNIRNQTKVKLFGIYGRETTYLDCQDSIDEYKSYGPLIGGLIFIIAGGLIFYYNRNKLKLEEK